MGTEWVETDVAQMDNATVGDAGPAPWFGFAVVRARQPGGETCVCAMSATGTGWQMEIGGNGARDWQALARELFAGLGHAGTYEMMRNVDDTAGTYRAMAFVENALAGALLVAPQPLAIRRDWLVARLGTPLDAQERFRLLDGRPGGPMRPRGAIVCHCCYVGRNEIVDAISAGAQNISAVGIATRAGTNCRRCQPEIGKMLAASSEAPIG